MSYPTLKFSAGRSPAASATGCGHAGLAAALVRPVYVIIGIAVASLITTPLSAAPQSGRPLAPAHDLPVGGTKDDARAVVQASDGTLLVGSNLLAAFDGAAWQPIPVADAYGFRALAPATGPTATRVWVGGIGALGYTERGEDGVWRYVSLLPDLARANVAVPADVWGVQPLGNGAVWVTDDRVLRWQPEAGEAGPGTFQVWALPAKSHLTLFGGGEQVFIHQEGMGLLRLSREGGPGLFIAEKDLPATPVTWMLPGAGGAAESLVGLQDRAYALHADRRFTLLPELSTALRGTLPTSAMVVDADHIAVGTFNSGVVLATLAGQLTSKNFAAAALPDPAIYSLFASERNLWVASPSGVSRLDAPAHATWFERHATLAEGRPLRTLAHADRTFVLTTTGLFTTSATSSSATETPSLDLVARAPAAFTDVVAAGGDLWIAGFGGLWRWEKGTLAQEHFAPADVLRVCATHRLTRGVLFLEGYRLKALELTARGDWIARDLGVEIPDSPVTLLEDDRGEVWVSTMRRGVLGFTWEPAALRLRLRGHYQSGAGLPTDPGRIELTALGERLIAFTPAAVLALQPDRRAFVPVPELAGFTGLAAAHGTGRSNVWLLRPRALAAFGVTAIARVTAAGPGETLTLSPLEVPGLDASGTLTALDLTPAPTGVTYWVGGPLGLLRLDDAAVVESPPPPPPVSPPISETEAGVFRFPSPATINGAAYFYQTRLDGVDRDWLSPSREPTRRLSGLAPGAYRFDVRLIDRFGRHGAATSRTFAVLAPWWRTTPALVGYGGLFALLVLLVARRRIARLHRTNERLNQLVAERTREIELSSTAKSNFLENISHEIRNPLNGLTGLLGLLQAGRLDPREREIAQSLKSVAATLTQVFEDVLQFSKLEYGYGRLDLRPFALRALLAEITDVFGVQASQVGCTLAIEWPADLADGFSGDREKIKTILANFVSNALKYAPGAPVEIRVEATAETDGLVDLYLDVIDHGPGVPAAEQELIFKKFIRGQHAKSGAIPGTGLGLATCTMLAKLMNGSVGVESRAGHGATFSLKLLLPRAPLTAAPAPVDPADAPALSAEENWLIVDDEAYNRTVLAGIARELGIPADEAGTAKEVAERCARHAYTAVLLDWELPDANGGDVARLIRSLVPGDGPLILATTAHDSEEIRARCRAAGMDGFVLKPYDAARVRAALGAARSSRGAPPADELDLRAFADYARAREQTPEAGREAFLAALDAQLAELSAAVAGGQFKAAAGLAHRLRGLTGIVNATALNRAASQLETAASRAGAPECHAAWSAVQLAAEELRRQLRATASSQS